MLRGVGRSGELLRETKSALAESAFGPGAYRALACICSRPEQVAPVIKCRLSLGSKAY